MNRWLIIWVDNERDREESHRDLIVGDFLTAGDPHETAEYIEADKLGHAVGFTVSCLSWYSYVDLYRNDHGIRSYEAVHSARGGIWKRMKKRGETLARRREDKRNGDD